MAENAPCSLLEGRGTSGLIFLCDHASNALPDEFGRLGVEAAQLRRHIGFDIGGRR